MSDPYLLDSDNLFAYAAGLFFIFFPIFAHLWWFGVFRSGS